MMNLNSIAIESGVELAPAYEIDGALQPTTYTATLVHLEAILGKAAARLLTALDGMDRGGPPERFRGWQNGLGEDVGDELQAARDELVQLVRHVAEVEVDAPEIT